jgi:hypothetical protein
MAGFWPEADLTICDVCNLDGSLGLKTAAGLKSSVKPTVPAMN